MSEKKTASYRVERDKEGNRYLFFCDLSHALVCESEPIKTETPEEELIVAWEKFGKNSFNHCRKCGKWVTDVMYNPDVLNCVMCTPIEDYPDFCPKCGEKTQDPANFCHICGAKLFYGGAIVNEKTECS